MENTAEQILRKHTPASYILLCRPELCRQIIAAMQEYAQLQAPAPSLRWVKASEKPKKEGFYCIRYTTLSSSYEKFTHYGGAWFQGKNWEYHVEAKINLVEWLEESEAPAPDVLQKAIYWCEEREKKAHEFQFSDANDRAYWEGEEAAYIKTIAYLQSLQTKPDIGNKINQQS